MRNRTRLCMGDGSRMPKKAMGMTPSQIETIKPCFIELESYFRIATPDEMYSFEPSGSLTYLRWSPYTQLAAGREDKRPAGGREHALSIVRGGMCVLIMWEGGIV